ncbi:MAG: ARMT1-like domain-containing protein [bacterium]|nr:ARMT1-like domain-containing protein [bacterium]MDT8395698.1 ARMT1-like domain-containing protein [bacterium]
MKLHDDCRPCLLKQMEATARAAGADEGLVGQVAGAVGSELERLWDPACSPPAISAPLYHLTGSICGEDDPFLAAKVRYTREALRMLPGVQARILESGDPFEAAVRTAIAGNIIDFGTGIYSGLFDLGKTLEDFLQKPLFIDNVKELQARSASARKILYIGDNAGETVFDRPLLRLLDGAELYYAAKDGAVINDATVKDATLAGVHLHARIVSTGTRTPGTLLDQCSDEFLELFESADLVIAKGQGNFETLTELPSLGQLFLLFTVKCPVAARHLDAAMGDMVVMKW